MPQTNVIKDNFRANETKNELKDFVTFSQQIEAELDKELNAANLLLSKREKENAVLVQERDRYKVLLFLA